jgi:hypothetical protein
MIKYPGVSWDAYAGKWKGSLHILGRLKTLIRSDFAGECAVVVEQARAQRDKNVVGVSFDASIEATRARNAEKRKEWVEVAAAAERHNTTPHTIRVRRKAADAMFFFGDELERWGTHTKEQQDYIIDAGMVNKYINHRTRKR